MNDLQVSPQQPEIIFDIFRLNRVQRCVFVQSSATTVGLEPKEFDVLEVLALNLNKWMKFEQIIEQIGVLDVNQYRLRLRKKLGAYDEQGRTLIGTRYGEWIGLFWPLDPPNDGSVTEDRPAAQAEGLDTVGFGDEDLNDEAVSSTTPDGELIAPRGLSDLLRDLRPTQDASLKIFEPRGPSAFQCKPQPYGETQLFWENFNVGRRIDGGAIEICANFNLTQGLPLARTGWAPELVRLTKLEGDFDAGQVLADPEIIAAFEESERNREINGDSRILDPITHESLTRNGIKFAIVRVSPNVDERDDLTIALRQTDYVTIMQALPGISKYPEKRRRYGNANSMLNQVPNAMGVQFITLFEDGNVLTIFRHDNLAYDPSTWSFSGEEQFKDTDFEIKGSARTRRFLLRAIAEEVFPLAGASDEQELQKRLDYVEPSVRSMRIWSVFIQEPSLSFVLFAVFELGLTVEGYRRIVNNLRLSGCQLSGEGHYHTVKLRDAVRLLDGKVIAATPLIGMHQERAVSPEALHPTSRYRLGLLLEILSSAK